MQSFEFQELVDALRRLGLKHGDVVNVHSRLFTLGALRGIPVEKIPAMFLKAFQEVIGLEGTVVVPTFTTTFGRFGTPFVLEESPSEMGVFSEHVRKSPGAVRTLHPIQSLAALGGQAERLAGSHPRWNVGHDTIWDRMLKGGGTMVSIGIPVSRSISFMHQVEHLACVPYQYAKILRGEVRAGGQRIAHDFYLAARYLQYEIAYDLARFEKDLRAASALRHEPLGGNGIWAVSLASALEVGIKGLREEPYYLLEKPPAFVPGEMPCDGTTIEREGAAPRYFLV